MATAAEIREWARSQGLEVPAKGPVPPHLKDAYEAWHDDGGGQLPDGGDTTSEPGPPPGDPDERKPRNVSTPRTARLGGFGRRGGGAKKKRARPKHPRVPVDDLIATGWRALAGMARPLPATSRLLKIQAPVAGLILEDTVKGTAVDALLQPFARTTRSAEALAVLLGPPVLVTAIQLNPDAQPFLIEPLRELMLRWCKIAGPKMKEALDREREFEEEFGETVDDLIGALFAQPDQPASPAEAMRQEEDAVRQAQEAMMT